KLLTESSDKFGEKIVEKIAEYSATSLGHKLNAGSLHLEGVYRDTLRVSLQQIRPDPEFRSYGDWFDTWNRCLSSTEPLNLVAITPEQMTPDTLPGLFRDTMIHLDARGAAQRVKWLSLKEKLRVMPETLASTLNSRLPAMLEQAFQE